MGIMFYLRSLRRVKLYGKGTNIGDDMLLVKKALMLGENLAHHDKRK